ncbi:transposase [Rhizobium gallicum]|uniref:transposase n=1 Tax=Rhizobium gallicum TaxID=56730 RepID=UPI001939AF4A
MVIWSSSRNTARDVLSVPAIRHLRRIFAKLCRDFGAELIECDGEDDHLHLWCIRCEDRPVEVGHHEDPFLE